MGKGACFMKAVLHMVNRFKQRKVMCSHFRLIPSDEVQTVFRLSPSLFSHAPYGARQLLNQGMIATGNHYFERFAALCNTPGGSQGGGYGFALVHSGWYSAYRKPLRHAYARPSSPFRGGWTRLPDGGAGRPNGLTEGVLFDEWQQLKITNGTPFAAARHFPQRGQQGAVRRRGRLHLLNLSEEVYWGAYSYSLILP